MMIEIIISILFITIIISLLWFVVSLKYQKGPRKKLISLTASCESPTSKIAFCDQAHLLPSGFSFAMLGPVPGVVVLASHVKEV